MLGDKQLFVQLINESKTIHGQWSLLSTYRLLGLDLPVPQGRRRPSSECFCITPSRLGTTYGRLAGGGAIPQAEFLGK